jgi:hypothetical protein
LAFIYFLVAVSVILIVLMAFKWRQLSRREQELQQVGVELADVIASLEQKFIKKKKSAGRTPDISDPGMLATLLTVIVNKHGNLRLSMTDFQISDDAYVSLYVDTTSEELLLSLNHSLGEDLLTQMGAFGPADDTTFH